ncbi:MAG: MerR family transcriptional regulator [Actinopolymorphaceae bacterium]
MTSYAPAEVSERTGLSLDTLRYYERLGLYGPVERTAGGKRIYSDGDVAWLHLLICLRNAGLGITDLQRLIGNLRNHSGSSASVVELLEDHRAKLLSQMDNMRTALGVLDGKLAHYRAIEERSGRAMMAKNGSSSSYSPEPS